MKLVKNTRGMLNQMTYQLLPNSLQRERGHRVRVTEICDSDLKKKVFHTSARSVRDHNSLRLGSIKPESGAKNMSYADAQKTSFLTSNSTITMHNAVSKTMVLMIATLTAMYQPNV